LREPSRLSTFGGVSAATAEPAAMRYYVRPPGSHLWNLIDTDSLPTEVEQGRLDGTSRIRRDGESGEWSVDELCRIELASKVAPHPPTPATQPGQTQSVGTPPFPLRWLLIIFVVGATIFRAVHRYSADRAVAEYQARPLALEIVADDPVARAAVIKAFQTPFQAPSCRITEEVSNYVDSFAGTKITTEFSKPDKVHVREEVGGKLKSESFTDGKKLLVRNGPDGEFKEETQDVAGKIKRLTPSPPDPAPGDKMQQAGHEEIKGVPATVYKWEFTRLVPSREKLWVADADGRLLKVEGESKGTVAFLKQPIRVDSYSTTTYEYDVPVNISLPGQ
ncbi:MAG: hypothetical protein M3N48_15845, partial [Verrucomicrobiota bacterium]|nr:hypothetical protein [Verrucomicrobiota bacterium]